MSASKEIHKDQLTLYARSRYNPLSMSASKEIHKDQLTLTTK